MFTIPKIDPHIRMLSRVTKSKQHEGVCMLKNVAYYIMFSTLYTGLHLHAYLRSLRPQ